MRWKIYYVDGSTVDSDSRPGDVHLIIPRAWIEAPSDGVIAVTRAREDVERIILSGSDAYYALPRNHHGSGEIGMADDLGSYLRSLGIAKFGVWTSDANWKKIYRSAVEDPFLMPANFGKAK